MSAVRRLCAVVAALSLTAIGVGLIGETTGVFSGRWRHELADGLVRVVRPTWPAWQSAVLGVVVALAALILIAAEFTRPPRGTRIMHPVHSDHNGATRISGRAAMHAAQRQVADIDGVVDSTATISKSELTLTVRLDDRADVDTIETEARRRLGHAFWIDLGLADFALNLLFTHHPRPPRVR